MSYPGILLQNYQTLPLALWSPELVIFLLPLLQYMLHLFFVLSLNFCSSHLSPSELSTVYDMKQLDFDIFLFIYFFTDMRLR